MKRNRKRKKRAIRLILPLSAVLAAAFAVALVCLRTNHRAQSGDSASSNDYGKEGKYYNSGKNGKDDDIEEIANSTDAPFIKVNTDPSSFTVLVNRNYPLPADYVPEDLTIPNVGYSYSGIYEKSYMRKAAADALEKMFKSAQRKKGYILKVVSAYRSYDRQKAIYENNVNTRGEEQTNKVSAKPGTSEHQTGLAIDISSDDVGCALDKSFAKCPEGRWVAKNCHKFGFIIRYPKNKSRITGYEYEPWHVRYLGKDMAKYLHKKKLTLEEYYQTTTVDEQVTSTNYVNDSDVGWPNGSPITVAPTPKTDAYQYKKVIPQPTDTPIYKDTQTQAPEPSKAPRPSKTPKPSRTPKPSKTPKPLKTPEPSNAPESAAPQQTQAPAQTSLPPQSAAPETAENPTPALPEPDGRDVQ